MCKKRRTFESGRLAVTSKIFMCICLFGLSCQKNYAQDPASETWTTAHFGKRFIPAVEAGFEKIEIPFTQDDLKYDELSWIIPYENNRITEYHLIQALYSPNEYQENEPLSLSDAVKVIQVAQLTSRNFPDNKPYHYFRTPEKSIVKGIENYKTIFCDSITYTIIDLPANVTIVSKGKKTTSYISEDAGGMTISMDLSDMNEETIGCGVMTLVKLIKTPEITKNKHKTNPLKKHGNIPL